ncbi:hypothetical protein GCM10010524_14540 [Streptomyces mexicanus]
MTGPGGMRPGVLTGAEALGRVPDVGRRVRAAQYQWLAAQKDHAWHGLPYRLFM